MRTTRFQILVVPSPSNFRIEFCYPECICVSHFNHVLLIGTGTITQLVDIEGEEDYVSSVAWIKEGNFLAVGVSDGSIQVSQP